MKYLSGIASLASRYVGGMSPLFLATMVSLAFVPATGLAQSVFYVADQDTDEKNELFYRDAKSGAIRKLNSPLVSGGQVDDVIIDAKGKVALYTADGDVDEQRELYKVDVKSGAVTKVSEPLQPGGYVLDSVMNPKGTDVVYMAEDGFNKFDIFHTNLKTGVVRKINEELNANGYISSYDLSATGKHAVYTADRDINAQFDVYLSDLGTGAVIKINSPLPMGAYSVKARFDPLGNNVLYSYRTSGQGSVQLFHYNIKTTALRPIPNTTMPDIVDYSITAKGTGIAYIQRVGEVVELRYQYLKTGLDILLAEGNTLNSYFSQCVVEPKGKFVLFISGSDETRELYKADLKTGLVTKLADHIQPGGRVWSMDVDAKRQNVYYIASAIPDTQELFRQNLKTGVITPLNAPLTGDDEVIVAMVGKKSNFAVYSYAGFEHRKLNIVDLKTGAVSGLNPTFPLTASVRTFVVPDSLILYGD